MLLALVIGLAFGFLGSMPIAGPTAVVLVSKGLDNQVRAGIHIAVGAAVAESAYAFMAFWGLTAVLGRYPVLLPASRLVGAGLLAALGVYFLVRESAEQKAPERDETTPRAGFRNVLFGLSLTAVNPMLLVTWTAAVSAAHSTGLLRVHALDAFPFAGGVGAGIVAWFVALLWLLARFRNRLKTRTIDRVLRAMGVVLLVSGVALGLRAVVKWNDTPDRDHAKSRDPEVGR